MKNYMVEFFEDNEHPIHPIYEEVYASSAQDAVDSIILGWPQALIQNVWVEHDENDTWFYTLGK